MKIDVLLQYRDAIDRETALKSVASLSKQKDAEHFLYRAGYEEALYLVSKMLKDEKSTPKVEPFVHGKWQYHLMPMALKCSACNRPVGWRRKIDYKFCPYCGAKMDLKDYE